MSNTCSVSQQLSAKQHPGSKRQGASAAMKYNGRIQSGVLWTLGGNALGFSACGSLPPKASSGIGRSKPLSCTASSPTEPFLKTQENAGPRLYNIDHRPFIDLEKMVFTQSYAMIYIIYYFLPDDALSVLIPKSASKPLPKTFWFFNFVPERSREGFFPKNCCQNQLFTSSTWHTSSTCASSFTSPIFSTQSSLHEPQLHHLHHLHNPHQPHLHTTRSLHHIHCLHHHLHLIQHHPRHLQHRQLTTCTSSTTSTSLTSPTQSTSSTGVYLLQDFYNFIYTGVVAQQLLHRSCYTGVVTQELLRRSCQTGVVTEEVPHRSCYTQVVTRELLQRSCYTRVDLQVIIFYLNSNKTPLCFPVPISTTKWVMLCLAQTGRFLWFCSKKCGQEMEFVAVAGASIL